MKTLKRTLCLVLVAVMALSLFAVAASAKKLSDYSDAASVSSDYQVAVDVATQLGILEGMDATTYGVKGNLTRAQLATMLYRMVTGDVAKKYVANYAGGAAFTDVKADAWYAGYVNYSADKGLLAGVGNNKYNPNSALTGYETLAAFLRALGYGKNGEFVGATWKAGVTKYADVIAKDIVADWSKPITREVAAQLIYNTLTAKMVTWNEFSKSYVEGFKTLAYDVFKAVPSINYVDDYGTLGEIWTAGSTQIVKAAYPVVKSYNVETTGCTILKDLGIPETDLTSAPSYKKWTYEGESEADTLTHKASDCAVTFGGQGVMTTIYKKATNNYVIAEVETYLAKIASNTAAAAHVEAEVKANVFTESYKTGTEVEVENGAAFAKGTFVLVIRGKDTWTVIGAAPSKVATLDKYDTSAIALPTWTVAGAAYAANVNWFYNENYKTTTPSTTSYTWYFDQFGNLIGIDDYAAPKTYGVIDSMYWQDKGHESGAADAKIYYMDASSATTELTKVEGKTLYNADVSYGVPGLGTVSANKDLNKAYYADLYEISGTTVKKAGEKLYDVDLTKGAPDIDGKFGSYSGTATTVYLLRYKDANDKIAYASYTGYAAMASVEGADVYVVRGDDRYVEYAFVDATVRGASVTDTVATTVTAWVPGTTAATSSSFVVNGTSVTEYCFTVYVDGVATTIKTLGDEVLTKVDAGISKGEIWKFVADSTGYVKSATQVTTYADAKAEDITVSGTSIYLKLGAHRDDYNAATAAVYVYDSTTGKMATKTIADIDDTLFDTAGISVAVTFATDSTEVLTAIYVW